MCNQFLTWSVSSILHIIYTSQFSQGALFTHWIADSLTLWKSPVTDEHLWTAATYYSILANGPPETLYFLSAVVVLGGITILWSLRDGQAGNIMFDGGSICGPPFIHFKHLIHLACTVLFGTTIVMYLHSVLPSPFYSLVSRES
jgi:ER membrane protein SH3